MSQKMMIHKKLREDTGNAWNVEDINESEGTVTLWMNGVPRNFSPKDKWKLQSIADAHNATLKIS